jgi:hypothetical protein
LRPAHEQRKKRLARTRQVGTHDEVRRRLGVQPERGAYVLVPERRRDSDEQALREIRRNRLRPPVTLESEGEARSAVADAELLLAEARKARRVEHGGFGTELERHPSARECGALRAGSDEIRGGGTCEAARNKTKNGARNGR